MAKQVWQAKDGSIHNNLTSAEAKDNELKNKDEELYNKVIMTLEQIVESAKTKKYITYNELDTLADIDEGAGNTLYQNYRLDWESFWGLDIGDGEFIILNNLFQIEGPRPTTGLVGYHDNGNVDIDKTLALIEQAGEPAIKCYIDAYEAHLEEEAKAEEAKILAEKLNGANNG